MGKPGFSSPALFSKSVPVDGNNQLPSTGPDTARTGKEAARAIAVLYAPLPDNVSGGLIGAAVVR